MSNGSTVAGDGGAGLRNVLLIVSDEHNHRAMGCAGHPVVQTPTLDSLAARGRRFARAWTPSPMCVPARGSLATGRWVHELGTWSSAQPYTGDVRGWAHEVRAVGAHSVSVGKLHYRGGEDDYGFTENELPMFVPGGVGWVQGLPRRNPLPYPEAAELAADVGVGDTTYTRYDRRVTDWACDWLTANGGGERPFALQVSLVAPHYPLSAPAEFVEPYLDDPRTADLEIGPMEIDHPSVRDMANFFAYHRFFDDDLTRRGRAAYFGLCTYLDHNIGRLLAALEAAGGLDDTLVIYTSDHGELMGNRGLWTKQFMFHDSVQVPMIVAGSGIAPAVVETAASLVDVHRTILEVVAPSAVDHYDGPGRSLLELPAADDGRPAFAEFHDGGSTTGTFALEHDGWKLVVHVGQPSQLFDRINDPDELIDLGQDPAHRERVAALTETLRVVVDPVAADTEAFRSQAELIDALGGRDGLGDHLRFNHTPVPD